MGGPSTTGTADVTTGATRTILIGRKMVVREALSVLLQQTGEADIIAVAETDEEALSLIARLRPDLIISTYAMPEIDPVRLAHRVTEELRLATPILVLTIRADPAQIISAIRSPIIGILHTAVTPEALPVAIKAARLGITVLGPQAREAIVKGLARPVPEADASQARPELTPREQHVVRLIASGLSTKEVAARLGVGIRTVEMYVARIVDKVGAKSRTQAVVAALRLMESESQTP